MRPVLVRVVVVAFAVAVSAVTGSAQGQRQLEFTVLGGTAHTDRVARLSAEQWIEPFSGLRVDARLGSLWGGRTGVAVQLDHYGVQRTGRAPPPCLGMCIMVLSLPPSDALVGYGVKSSDSRVHLGATWQRPIVSWLRADLVGLVGVRRTSSETHFDDQQIGSPAVSRPIVGGEVGVSTQWRSLVTGAGFQYSSGTQWGGVRRGQNRVMLRVGYALPLGSE